MADEPTQRELSDQANDRLREAAKWLVGAFAAVGAALIAGSQLSSIGRLPCDHFPAGCGRLLIAIASAVIGLGGVAWAIWLGVGLLTPESLPPNRLQHLWNRREKSAIFRFFRDNRSYLQGYEDFQDIQRQEEAKGAEFDAKSKEYDAAPISRRAEITREIERIAGDMQDLYDRSEAAVAIANQVAYRALFKHQLSWILAAATLAAGGIGAFAWAGNPPDGATGRPAALSGADLSGSDLTGANLRDADMKAANLSRANLTEADLEGADLNDATILGVTWSGTVCPDGRVSDDVGGTCENHLSPAKQ